MASRAAYRNGCINITKPEGTHAPTLPYASVNQKKRLGGFTTPRVSSAGPGPAPEQQSEVPVPAEPLTGYGWLTGPMDAGTRASSNKPPGEERAPPQIRGRASTTADILRTGRGPTTEAYHYPGCYLRPSAHLTRGPSAQCRRYHTHATVADCCLGSWCRRLLPLGMERG